MSTRDPPSCARTSRVTIKDAPMFYAAFLQKKKGTKLQMLLKMILCLFLLPILFPCALAILKN